MKAVCTIDLSKWLIDWIRQITLPWNSLGWNCKKHDIGILLETDHHAFIGASHNATYTRKVLKMSAREKTVPLRQRKCATLPGSNLHLTTNKTNH